MSIYSNYIPKEQPRDLMIVARWEDDTSPLGRLFGWKREVDIYGNYVDRNDKNNNGNDGNRNDGGNEGSEEVSTFRVDNSFLCGFILGVGFGLMFVDLRSRYLSLRGAL